MKKSILAIITSSIIILSFFAIFSCEEEETNHEPTCSIISPVQDSTILKGEIVIITADADDEDGNLKEVRFYINNTGVSSTSTFPYTYRWNTSEVDLGIHSLKAEAVDDKNAKSESSITIEIIDNSLVADFVADKTVIALDDTIYFTDLSETRPYEWTWSFGDGQSSTEQNPSHKYSNAGIYNVSLTVKNDFSSDSETKSNYITVQTLPTISTNNISEYTATTAIVGGNITNDGYSDITERGVYYGTTENPEVDGIKFQINSNNELFSDTISNLTVNTTYYIRAYAINTIGTNYGNTVSLTTEEGLPLLSTSSVSDVTAISATSGGEITSNGGFDITARGVCWSTSSNPTINDNKTADGTGTGSFNSNITNLDLNTTYYLRAYATNAIGTSYGSELSFTTEDGIPVLTTTSASNINGSSANSGGNITDDGGLTVITKGVCWSTSTNPTINDSKTEDGTGIGNFVSGISGLNPSTTYFVRSYATNSNGTFYGNSISFETTDGLAVISTTEITDITAISALSGGEITDDGGFPVSEYGICWSTSTNPTLSNDHTSDGSGIGGYSSNLTGLNVNTTYYIRAYATNDAGTSFGEELSFTTDDGLPTGVSTEEITDILATSAVGGGSISDDGGFSITSRGVCWSTSFNPTINDNKTNDGTGTGIFTSNLTELAVNTTYYVRAYATNTNGTVYGSEFNFTTDDGLPTVTTIEISNITSTSAQSGGNITDDGGFAITTRGVCWSTSQNPNINDNKTTDGTGTGSFTSNLTGLDISTTYYLKSYASNSVGTSYGNEITFTTKDITGETGTLTDIDGNSYNWIGIGVQAWMAENLKTTRYADGTVINLVESQATWDALTFIDKAYCYYDNSSVNGDAYGALYTWAGAMNGASSSSSNPSGVQGVCPDGWHIPSDDEWTELINFITNNGYSGIEGSALKSTSGWYNDGNGNDNFEFNALPGGSRYNDGQFFNLNFTGYFWSATGYDTDRAWFRYLYYNNSDITKTNYLKKYGFSVRCIRDE